MMSLVDISATNITPVYRFYSHRQLTGLTSDDGLNGSKTVWYPKPDLRSDAMVLYFT